MKIGVQISEMAQAISSGNWSGTAPSPYPAVTLGWLEWLETTIAPAIAIQRPMAWENTSEFDPYAFSALPRWRLSLALINTGIVLGLFGLIRKLYDTPVAVTATILIAFDPFLLTESRVFRTEGLTTGLMMLSTLTLFMYMRERRWAWLISSGALAGLAILSRISAVYLFPFAGLVLLTWPWLAGQKAGFPRLTLFAGEMLIWSGVTLGTIVACWPVLWVSPFESMAVLQQYLLPALTNSARVWKNGIFFRGQIQPDPDPGPLFYVWALAYRTTPLVWGGLVVGLTFIGYRRKLRRSSYLATTILLGAYILCYITMINLTVIKIDRYIVAVLPAFSILAAVGIQVWLSTASRASALWQGAVWGLILGGSLAFSLPHHPYYYTYWNPLLGGGKIGVTQLPAMGRQGVDVLVDYLNRLPNASELYLTGSGLDLELRQECPAVFVGSCLEQPQFLKSDYLLDSIYSQQNRAPLTNIQALVPDVEIVQKYSHAGVDYVWLYKMPEDLHYVGHWLDLSSGSFSGYRLSATEIGAGESVEVTLFWQNGEKSGWRFDDSELFVKVLNEIGQVQQVSVARLEPNFELLMDRPNEILVFKATLNFPPETALGLYPLEMGLRLKASQEETVLFPLPLSANALRVNRGSSRLSPDALAVEHRLEQPVGETGLMLIGYDGPVTLTSAQPALLYTYWWLEKPSISTYILRLALLDEAGQTVASWDRPFTFPSMASGQAGELVKLPLMLELGQTLPPGSYRPLLSVFTKDQPGVPPLLERELELLPPSFKPAKPAVSIQHSLEGVTFGEHLDLLGYDLGAKIEAQGGQLFVILHWLNRQPGQPREAQVQVVAGNGAVIAEETLPIPLPEGLMTWGTVSEYKFLLKTTPETIVIRTRPVGGTEWDAGAPLLIGNLLNKVTPLPEE